MTAGLGEFGLPCRFAVRRRATRKILGGESRLLNVRQAKSDGSENAGGEGFVAVGNKSALASRKKLLEASEMARNLRRFKMDHGARIRGIDPLIKQDHWRPAGQRLDFASFDKRMTSSVTHAVASAVAPDERSSVPANTAETKSATHG